MLKSETSRRKGRDLLSFALILSESIRQNLEESSLHVETFQIQAKLSPRRDKACKKLVVAMHDASRTLWAAEQNSRRSVRVTTKK